MKAKEHTDNPTIYLRIARALMTLARTYYNPDGMDAQSSNIHDRILIKANRAIDAAYRILTHVQNKG